MWLSRKKFRLPEFIKYTGTQCPITHLKSYCNKMAEVVHDEKLLMHFFQDSLSGAALSWYMRLDNTKIRKWKDLVDAFVKQYKYNMDITCRYTTSGDGSRFFVYLTKRVFSRLGETKILLESPSSNLRELEIPN